MDKWLRLGTRGSPLALAQANATRLRLAEVHRVPPEDIAVEIIRTTGDAVQDRPLAEAGGKGLFTKEIDAALLAGAIDLAVHSAKDLPTELPEGLGIAGYLPREDARDALISAGARSIAELPKGGIVGTASLRRKALLRRARPDLRIVLLRGNVGTRLQRVESGEIDATLLALAGLKRLGLAARATAILPIEQFTPAVGQGAIAVTTRCDDRPTREALAPIVDLDTGLALACERAFLRELDGSFRTPIAGHATVSDGHVRFSGIVLRRNGADARETSFCCAAREAEARAAEAGKDIRSRLPPDFFVGA